jgi:RNA polymerase sigma factor (sigma-70 family)
MSLRTTELPDLLARLRGGDRGAADELLRRCRERLEAIARVMLRRFPVVAAREQTADVVQEASLSLLAALRTLDVKDTRSFYALAAEHISRRLLDLARKHRRRDTPPAAEDPDTDLDLWTELHEAAARLPVELREVFALRFYHGWTFAEIAALLGVSGATARRRWLEALAELEGQLRDLPE